MRAIRFPRIAFLAAFTLALAGCDFTGLPEDRVSLSGRDASLVDASSGVSLDAGTDAGPDAAADACVAESDGALAMRLCGVRVCGSVQGADNCGAVRSVPCGTCAGTNACSDAGTCACVAETTAELVAQHCPASNGCGDKTVTDRCGGERLLSCGTCAGLGQTCGGGEPGAPNVCGCTPETTPQFCGRLGKNCGAVTAMDTCGRLRPAVDCGSCVGPQSCGGGGLSNVCGCTPASCSGLGKNCGSIADGCGGTLACGSCSGANTCGGGNPGTANVCGCTPESDASLASRLCGARVCGSMQGADNCGASRTVSCGACGANQACNANGACDCVGETTQQLVNLHCGVGSCGDKSVTDRCGGQRTVSCGSTCAGTGQTCGGGDPGYANVCGCTPETAAQFCARLGKNCGAVTGPDSCGNLRTNVACGACAGVNSCGGGGTSNVCGCTPTTCAAQGKNCGSIADGCGGTLDCGSTCSALGATCGGGNPGAANVCGCTSESDGSLAARLCGSRVCGNVQGADNCGATRTVTCGACGANQSCDANGACACVPETNTQLANGNCGVGSCGDKAVTDRCNGQRTISCGSTCSGTGQTCGGGDPGYPNVCGCTPESAGQFCARLGKNCGSVSGPDNCGNLRSAVNCGSCTAPQTCGGGGVSQVCGCTPTTCSAQGKNCGSIADGCGGTIACGSCSSPNTCGGGNPGTTNVCGCTPETDAAFCTHCGAQCGAKSGVDNCGLNRTVSSCGSCTGTGETCGGGAQPAANVCGCTTETDAQFCARLGAECGQKSGTDNCGQARTVTSCGTCANSGTCSAQNVCPGTSCGGLRFDGSSYVSIDGGVPAALSGANQGKAIGAWVRISQAGADMVVAALGNDAGSCGTPSCGGVRFELFISNGRVAVVPAQGIGITTRVVPLDSWVYVLGGFDPVQGYFGGYISGGVAQIDVLGVVNTISVNTLTAGQPAWIGRAVYATELRFVGDIDRVDVFSPAPTQTEFLQYSAMTGSSLRALSKLYWSWDMNEGSGLSTSTGKNPVTGAITAASWWTSTSACPSVQQ